MLRSFYSWLLRLHPSRFRERFADEMMYVFDHEAKDAAWKVIADAIISLLRQRTIRWQYWDEKAVDRVLAGADGAPVFFTLASYRPRNTALFAGVAVTLFAGAVLFFGLAHSKVHPMYMPHVSFEKASDSNPPSSARRTSSYSPPRVASSVPPRASASGSTSSRAPVPLKVKKIPDEETALQSPEASQDTRQRQESSLQGDQPGDATASSPFLRTVVFKHHGFGNTLSDAIIDKEESYVNARSRLRVEAVYDQKIANNMKKELEDFWKGRGIVVNVSTNLSQVPSAPRYVVLEINICKK